MTTQSGHPGLPSTTLDRSFSARSSRQSRHGKYVQSKSGRLSVSGKKHGRRSPSKILKTSPPITTLRFVYSNKSWTDFVMPVSTRVMYRPNGKARVYLLKRCSKHTTSQLLVVCLSSKIMPTWYASRLAHIMGVARKCRSSVTWINQSGRLTLTARTRTRCSSSLVYFMANGSEWISSQEGWTSQLVNVARSMHLFMAPSHAKTPASRPTSAYLYVPKQGQ